MYLTFVYNVSISVALYGLMYFYQSAKELLREHNPFMKFLCIKGVLFLSYWQSLLIAILSATGSLPKLQMWSHDGGDQAAGWQVFTVFQLLYFYNITTTQDFLICCEMLIFAMLHKFVFGVQEVNDHQRVCQAKLCHLNSIIRYCARPGFFGNFCHQLPKMIRASRHTHEPSSKVYQNVFT